MAEIVRLDDTRGFTPALYDAMCRAIDASYAVDEVKEIRDRVMACEAYARQARNTEAERKACEIRLRAERKAGELLADMEKARGGWDSESRGSAPRLQDLGITKDQSSKWQGLGRIPQDEFDAALAGSEKPSTAGLLRASKSPDPDVVPVTKDALWLWGTLRDFEREGFFEKKIGDVVLTMTDSMKDDVHRLAPKIAAWLREL